jgi:uncharacterized integral membrane protein
MWRFIGLIIVLAVFLAFIGFNLDNSCDISFGFAKIEQAPVYLTVLVSLVLGLVCALPLALVRRIKKKKEPAKGLLAAATESKDKNNTHGIDS